MREWNSRDLLALVRRHMPCSRADLVRISGLTAPTVSAAIDALQRRGLVRFAGCGSPKGGRPPRILEFNARYGYVLGADIGGSGIRLALADLSGTIIGRSQHPITSIGSSDEVTALTVAGLQRLLAEHDISRQKVLQFVVGAPGITDVRSGRVLSAPNLAGWHDVPLAVDLHRQTGIPTTVENDVNLGAIGEGRCGVAAGRENFVFIAIGSGVGAGIVINGNLLHGANWSAGEVGYMQVPGLPGQALAVNRLGALESCIGGEGIKNAWLACANGNSNEAQRLRPTEIFDLAANGNLNAQRVLKATSEHLASAIVNISLVLDTPLVVLGGGIGRHAELVEACGKAVAKNEFANPQVLASSLGPDAQLHGAVWLAIQIADQHGFRRQPAMRKRTAARIKSRFA
ncbi:MAG: ROK family transcriptional regulator [Terriglobales bacterium]